MKTIFTIISVIACSFLSKAQVNLGVEYAKYTNNQTFSNDTIKTEFIIKNYGSTMYHTGDTIYVNAQINGVPFSLDLMSSNATPVVLTKMLHNGDTVHHNPGYLLGSATLAYLTMMGAPSTTLNVCIIVWGKGLASVSNYGGDVNTANNITCVTHDPAYVTGLNEANKKSIEISVYPNPSSNYLNFTFNTNQEYTISLFDLTGKEVKNVSTTQNKTSMDISNLNTGMYFYKISSKNSIVKSGKFIKE
jgi:hypothetical protein